MTLLAIIPAKAFTAQSAPIPESFSLICVPPVRSPVEAVRAAIVAECR